MANAQLTVAMPPGLILGGDWTIELQALDPATGAFVSPVNVRNTTIQVEVIDDGRADKQLPVLLIRGAGG